jgi:hypothetical protein
MRSSNTKNPDLSICLSSPSSCFSLFFNEIQSLPEENPLISLRYKAVNQYASEDKVFTFITLLSTKQALEGEEPDASIISVIQDEFHFSKPTISHHLDLLRQAGLVESVKQGQFIYYSLNTTVMDEIITWFVQFSDKKQTKNKK